MTYQYICVCRFCQKSSSVSRLTSSPAPPSSNPPPMSGKCSASINNGKHAPQWQRL